MRVQLVSALIVLAVTMLATPQASAAQEDDSRPNILIIMADDMGWSDLGCYGSEIPTPNLDRLAQQGLRFTQFYNTSKCGPTRAALLTGLYAHNAGLAAWTHDQGADAYRGTISHKTVTLAEPLKAAGYRTYAVGKWHAGEPKEHWPLKRGFSRYYGCIKGASDYFNPAVGMYSDADPIKHFVLDDKVVGTQGKTRERWYVTTQYTDYALKFLKDATAHEEPFFMYLAYSAPHIPLQALPEDIERFKDTYHEGWEHYRQQRLQRQLEMGLLDKNTKLPPPDFNQAGWEKLSKAKRQREALRMQVYAAMIWRMDHGIGKIIDQLDQAGELENTLIMFLSDNGAINSRSNKGDPSTAGSNIGLGDWANVANTPFQGYKADLNEGGVSTPLIVYWPKKMGRTARFTGALGHVMDLLPTCLDAANVAYPKQWTRNGQQYDIKPVDGRSLMPLILGETDDWREPRMLFWEFQDGRIVRTPKWKLVATKTKPDPWTLFDMQSDRVESHDLARQEQLQQTVAELSAHWQKWASSIGVEPWKKMSSKKRKQLNSKKKK